MIATLSWLDLDLSYFATDNWSVTQFVLVSSSSVTLDQILAEGKTITGLMSWCVFSDGRTGLPSLPDPLLESSSLHPFWSLLHSTLYRILHHLTLSGVCFTRPSTWVFNTWPPLDIPLLDCPLKSSNLSLSLVSVCSVSSVSSMVDGRWSVVILLLTVSQSVRLSLESLIMSHGLWWQSKLGRNSNNFTNVRASAISWRIAQATILLQHLNILKNHLDKIWW
jgi:hypothetical protein